MTEDNKGLILLPSDTAGTLALILVKLLAGL